MKRTPLYKAHQSLGARLIEFGGWEMPVQYSGINDEHLNVRRAAGIFDISHMGEVLVSGPGAEPFLNYALTNDVRKLSVGQAQYSLMCNELGGVIDDLYVYRLAPEEYLLIINASRIDVDVPWLGERAGAFQQQGLSLKDASDQMGALAIQGPKTIAFMGEVFSGASIVGTRVNSVLDLKKNEIARWDFQGQPVWVARTGYTGEDGFEVAGAAEVIEALWTRMLAAGGPHGLKPAGLGARDTLRTEVCYPLYGHELDETTTPIEAGLSFFVALGKEDFCGRSVLLAQKEEGGTKKLVAFKMSGPGPAPRAGYPIWSTGSDARSLGQVTSGTPSPSLNTGIGMGYVPVDFAKPEAPIEIEIRQRRHPATIARKPLYRKPD